jgi:hypothetical protein
MQAFACLVRLYEAEAAASITSNSFYAPQAEDQPELEAVRHLCWRMNLSR